MVANKGSTIINGNANSGHMITLNIHVPRDKIVQPMQFDVQMLIGDICRSIQGHLPITIDQDRKKKKKQTILFLFRRYLKSFLYLEAEYGLFINDGQYSSRSYWLDPSRTLNYYALKTGV
jgi:hypothetical protein